MRLEREKITRNLQQCLNEKEEDKRVFLTKIAARNGKMSQSLFMNQGAAYKARKQNVLEKESRYNDLKKDFADVLQQFQFEKANFVHIRTES